MIIVHIDGAGVIFQHLYTMCNDPISIASIISNIFVLTIVLNYTL